MMESTNNKKFNKVKERKSLKERGKSYKTYNGDKVEAKPPTKAEKICSCKFECSNLSADQKRKLFETFYGQPRESQGTYLMRLLSIGKIGRRRHGSYDTEENSRRQCTINYAVPDGKGNLIKVCKRTFMDVFSVSTKRLYILIQKVKMGDTVFKDKRTSHKKSEYGDEHISLVKEHILTLPKDVSHYSRNKSTKSYLSSELNFNRLHIAYNEKYPNQKVSYKFYKKTFSAEFPNLSFRKPRSDTCKTCDKFSNDIKHTNNPRGKELAQRALNLHHQKAEEASDEMAKDKALSQSIDGSFSCLAIDLQQVIFIPTLTHSAMFYQRQLGVYNLCINMADINQSYMCVWHEGDARRGGNEIASCLLKVLNSVDVTCKDNLSIWTDNCVGQNKNRMMIFLYIFLTAIGAYKEINHKFLLSGHSFMQCDRDFGLIEKRKKVVPCFVPEDVRKVIRSANLQRPYKVVDIANSDILDFQKAADTFIQTTNLYIKKCVWIRVSQSEPGVISVRERFTDTNWRKVRVLKKGVTIEQIKKCELLGVSRNTALTVEKKKDLTSMLPFINSFI